MSLLEARNLLLSFGGLKVLEDVSFSLDRGEKVGLIGPNGAGKTTLLNVLTGLLNPVAGQIYFLGQEITDMPPQKRVSLGMARSFQLNTLFFNLSVLSNILLAIQGPKASHFPKLRPITESGEIFVEAKQLLEPMDLWGERNFLVSTLSYGKQRQLEVLLALASKPKLLLLDEPSSGLSTGEAVNVLNTTRNLTRDTTLFFSAHDIDLVFTLADRVLVLYYGQIIAQGTPEVVQGDPLVKEIYLGIGDGHA